MIDSRKSNWALILVLAVLGLFPRILGAAGIEEPLKAALELHESGKIKEAIAEYDKVIKTHPKLAEAYFNRGNAYYDLGANQDRKSTRLNSSHMSISYAVFCLKKKKKTFSKYLHNRSESN